MSTAAYQLSSLTGVLAHGWQRSGQVRDGTEAAQELEALVRSGDYFVTLATELDQISRDTTDYTVKMELENAISDLIYLQDHYSITKNETGRIG